LKPNPVPDPNDMVRIETRRVISAATCAGTTSISSANAPADSKALLLWNTCAACAALRPTACMPPTQVAFGGTRPT